jgi:hypothetical protein
VISGNAQYGIRISGGGSDNVVAGNDIGTAEGGSSALGNTQDGVHIQDSASNNTIGGKAVGAGNVIEVSILGSITPALDSQNDAIITDLAFDQVLAKRRNIVAAP